MLCQNVVLYILSSLKINHNILETLFLLKIRSLKKVMKKNFIDKKNLTQISLEKNTHI